MSLRPSRSHPRYAAAAFVSLAVALAGLVSGCTDGTTPDCSDAAAGCSPDLDGSVDAPPDDASTDPLDAGAADAQDG